jgi:type IV secretory pathway VirB2 component (pilin)
MSVAILYPSLADPSAPSSVSAAVSWIEATALGTVATSVAVIAVGVVGLMMLNGQLQVRRGVSVVLGCFILFGAPALAAGIRGIVSTVAPVVAIAPPPIEAPPPIPVVLAPARPTLPPPPPPSYDPYAGASVRPQ